MFVRYRVTCPTWPLSTVLVVWQGLCLLVSRQGGPARVSDVLVRRMYVFEPLQHPVFSAERCSLAPNFLFARSIMCLSIFSLSYNSCLAVMVLVVVHRYCLSSDVQLPCVVTASPHRGDGGTPGPAWVLGTAGSSLRSFGRDHVGSHLHTVLGQGFGVARPTSGMQSLERTLLLVMHCIGVASSNGIFPDGIPPRPRPFPCAPAR